MLAGSVCTFQTMALTHKRELQTQATAIYMFHFKVRCRRALMENEAVTIVSVTLNCRNTLNSSCGLVLQ